MLFVKPTTACFDVAYAVPDADAREPASDPTLTIEPFPASSMRGRTARVRRMTAVTLTVMTRSHVASSTSALGRKPSMMPATLARASTRPPAAATTASIVVWALTSPATVTSASVPTSATSFEAVLPDVGGDDACALREQPLDRRAADAGARAGDDRRAALEPARDVVADHDGSLPSAPACRRPASAPIPARAHPRARAIVPARAPVVPSGRAG